MLFSEDTWVKLFLIAVGLIILTVIYFTARWNTLVGAIVLGVGVWLWLTFTPSYFHDSDPAGNAMEAGFDALFNIIKVIVMAVVFYLFMKYSNPDKVLNISMIILFLYFVKRFIFMNID